MQREDILAEIRRTAQENGGKPLGKVRFERATGIKEYEWQKFWPRIAEAQREAGFTPNQFKIDGYSDNFLLGSIARLVRELGRFPVQAEIRIKRRSDSTFPEGSAFTRRFGNKAQMVVEVLRYCQDDPDYADVAALLEPIATLRTNEAAGPGAENLAYGFVYLVRGHPGEYKIGRTNLVDRRLSELGATASIEQQLIHEIKTDDPSGIEAYWHKRFHDKRMRGEWFRLNAEDVKAFRRWRKIF